jgi:hypothetical protein
MDLVGIGSKEFFSTYQIFTKARQGNPCHYYSNVEDALEYSRKIPPHLVIMDSKTDVPEKIRFAQYLRKRGYHTDITLVVTTLNPKVSAALEKINIRLILPEQIEPLILETIEKTATRKITRKTVRSSFERKGVEKGSGQGIQKTEIKREVTSSEKQSSDIQNLRSYNLKNEGTDNTPGELVRSGIDKNEHREIERAGVDRATPDETGPQDTSAEHERTEIKRQGKELSEKTDLTLGGLEKETPGTIKHDGAPTSDERTERTLQGKEVLSETEIQKTGINTGPAKIQNSTQARNKPENENRAAGVIKDGKKIIASAPSSPVDDIKDPGDAVSGIRPQVCLYRSEEVINKSRQ